MYLFCSYRRVASERKAFCVCSVLFASRSGEHLKYAKGGKLRRAGSALPRSLPPTHTHLQLHKHQGSGIRKLGHALALLNVPSVKCEAKSLKPPPNLSVSYVLRAGYGESSRQFSPDLPRKGLSRPPPRERIRPRRLTVIEDSVDLLSRDFARRCGDRGDADTSRMEPTAEPSQVKSCVNSVSPDQRRN